jgi:hypothetical protein
MVNGLLPTSRFRKGTYGQRELDPRVASVLRLARWRYGWTVRQAGERLGLSIGYVCELEHGNRVF